MYYAITTEYEYELFTSSYSRTSTLVREYVIYYYYSTPLVVCCDLLLYLLYGYFYCAPARPRGRVISREFHSFVKHDSL